MTLENKLKKLTEQTVKQQTVNTEAIERAKKIIAAAKQAAKTPTK